MRLESTAGRDTAADAKKRDRAPERQAERWVMKVLKKKVEAFVHVNRTLRKPKFCIRNRTCKQIIIFKYFLHNAVNCYTSAPLWRRYAAVYKQCVSTYCMLRDVNDRLFRCRALISKVQKSQGDAGTKTIKA